MPKGVPRTSFRYFFPNRVFSNLPLAATARANAVLNIHEYPRGLHILGRALFPPQSQPAEQCHRSDQTSPGWEELGQLLDKRGILAGRGHNNSLHLRIGLAHSVFGTVSRPLLILPVQETWSESPEIAANQRGGVHLERYEVSWINRQKERYWAPSDPKVFLSCREQLAAKR